MVGYKSRARKVQDGPGTSCARNKGRYQVSLESSNIPNKTKLKKLGNHWMCSHCLILGKL